jgi:hypothetical protein
VLFANATPVGREDPAKVVGQGASLLFLGLTSGQFHG